MSIDKTKAVCCSFERRTSPVSHSAAIRLKCMVKHFVSDSTRDRSPRDRQLSCKVEAVCQNDKHRPDKERYDDKRQLGQLGGFHSTVASWPSTRSTNFLAGLAHVGLALSFDQADERKFLQKSIAATAYGFA